MKSGIFVTGTNTGVGKTLISSLIMTAATAHGWKPRYFKPIQTGDDFDHDTVKKLTQLDDHTVMPPFISLAAPMAAYRAAALENRVIDTDSISTHWENLGPGHFVVEGGGGLLHPLTQNFYMRDLIKMLNLPIVIVATTILGTINHTLLTIEAALKENIPIKGIILSGPEDPGLKTCLEELTSVKVIAEVPWTDPLTHDHVQHLAKTLFNKELLSGLFNINPILNFLDKG